MKRFFCFFSLTVSVSIFLMAAEPSDDTLYYELQSIEVVAVRAEKATAAATSELDSKRIGQESYGQDVPSLFQGLTSVTITSESGTGIGSTGLRIRGMDPTRINVTMNGMPLNNPDSHSMYWYDTPDLLGGTGKVQLIRGAGTTTNGSGAFGGAVCMASAPVPTTFGGDVCLSYGAFNTSRQALHVSSGLLGDHWATDLRLSHISTDGYIDRGFSRMGSYMYQTAWYGPCTVVKFISFGGKTKTYLTYNGVSRTDLALYGPRYHTSGQYVTSDGPFVLEDGTHVAYFDDQTDNYFQTINQLILDRVLSQRWTLNAMLHYTFGDGYYRQYKDDAWLAGYDNLVADWSRADLIRRKVMKNHMTGANVSAVRSAAAMRLVLGGSYLYYFCPHYGTLDWIDGLPGSMYEQFRWFDNKARKHDANVFAKADWTVSSALTAHFELQCRIVGYRADGSNDNYDWERGVMQPVNVDKTWNFLNPGVSLAWTCAECHELIGSFFIASKEPTRSDFTDRYLFSSLTDEPRPERLYDGELVWKYTGSGIRATAGLYYMFYRDQLVPTGVVNDSEDNLNVNVDRSFRRGLEAGLFASPFRFLDLEANCTLSQNRICSLDKSLTYSPSVLGNAVARFHCGNFEASVRGQYVGKQYVSFENIDSRSLDPYFVGNIDLGYELKSLRFALRVANFTNSRYFSYGYGDYVFPQAPANVSGSVSIKF